MNQGSKVIVILIVLSITSGCGNNHTDAHKLTLEKANVFTFTDGESVSTWKYPNDSKLIYRLDDGTELLAVTDARGPENVMAEGVESIQALEQAAQDNMIEFYKQQGALYNIEDYLKKAYAEYTSEETGPSYRCYLLSQETFPSASNEEIIYCTTDVFLPLGQGVYDEYDLTRAFDKKSGRSIDSWDLFSAPEDEVKSAFVSAYTSDSETKNVLLADFQPAYIRFSADGYEIVFPCETSSRIEKEGDLTLTNIAFSGEYTDEILSVLHAWAIPD